MGLDIATKSDRRHAVIFTDLQALQNPGRPSGQYIIRKIIEALTAASTHGLYVEFHWIPAHQGIEGNELADRLAKEPTGWTQTRGRRGRLLEGDSDNTATTPAFVKYLKSAAKTELNRYIQSQWALQWETETRGRTTHSLTPTPTRAILQVHTSLHKALAQSSFRCEWKRSACDISSSGGMCRELQMPDVTVKEVTKRCDMFFCRVPTSPTSGGRPG